MSDTSLHDKMMAHSDRGSTKSTSIPLYCCYHSGSLGLFSHKSPLNPAPLLKFTFQPCTRGKAAAGQASLHLIYKDYAHPSDTHSRATLRSLLHQDHEIRHDTAPVHTYCPPTYNPETAAGRQASEERSEHQRPKADGAFQICVSLAAQSQHAGRPPHHLADRASSPTGDFCTGDCYMIAA